MTLFEILNHINLKTKTEDDVLLNYNSFIINRAFSMGKDTVFYANEMNNNYGYDKVHGYDFYYHIIPKAKRFNSWAKKSTEADETLLQLICDKYNVTLKIAATYAKLMSDAEKSQINISRGGVSEESSSGIKNKTRKT